MKELITLDRTLLGSIAIISGIAIIEIIIRVLYYNVFQKDNKDDDDDIDNMGAMC